MTSLLGLLLVFQTAGDSLETSLSEPEPVTRTFRSTNIINQRSVDQLYSKTAEFRMGHRFGDSYSGLKDLFGIDLGASAYFGLDYGILDDWMAGFSRLGGAGSLKTYEFHSQYRLLSQKTEDGSPVTLSLYGEADFATADGAEQTHLLIMPLIARKWTKAFSTQISPFYVQRLENKDSYTGAQPIFGSVVAANYVLSRKVSLTAEWIPVFNRTEVNSNSLATYKWNTLSAGVNLEISGHTFQLLVSNTQNISTVGSLLGSNTDWTGRHFFIGFNITRLYSFETDY